MNTYTTARYAHPLIVYENTDIVDTYTRTHIVLVLCMDRGKDFPQFMFYATLTICIIIDHIKFYVVYGTMHACYTVVSVGRLSCVMLLQSQIKQDTRVIDDPYQVTVGPRHSVTFNTKVVELKGQLSRTDLCG